jgi:hypothetical protein
MNDSPRHPSFLALDRLAAADLGPPDVRGHVAESARCSEYVHSIREGAPLPQLAPRRPPRHRQWPIVAGVAAVIAAAAGVAILLEKPQEPEPIAYVGTKGQPSLALYVKRAEEVFAWQQDQFVMPGDRLRIEVAADGFEHITVLSYGALERKLERLYDSRIDPSGSALLPVAWQVDDAPGDETLVVVLSPAALSEDEITGLLDHPERASGIWLKRLLLRKRLEGELK